MARPNPKDFIIQRKKGETIVKRPGDIRGYDFCIMDCVDCTIVLADFSAQLQIDDCVNCKIFIGPVDGSAFFRDCKVRVLSRRRLVLRDLLFA